MCAKLARRLRRGTPSSAHLDPYNSIIYTAGDTVTYARLADIVDSVLGRKVQGVEWTVPKLKDELAKGPNNPIKKYRAVFAEGRGSRGRLTKRSCPARNPGLGSRTVGAGEWRDLARKFRGILHGGNQFIAVEFNFYRLRGFDTGAHKRLRFGLHDLQKGQSDWVDWVRV